LTASRSDRLRIDNSIDLAPERLSDQSGTIPECPGKWHIGNLQAEADSKPIKAGPMKVPQWFVGSSFDFSADNRQLIYKAGREGGIHIDLKDGSVWKN
jgi:hypothetical protein